MFAENKNTFEIVIFFMFYRPLVHPPKPNSDIRLFNPTNPKSNLDQ